MEIRKLALYYGVDQDVIGVRECLHDWQEGDVINTNGAKTEIYAVFDGTMSNLMLLVEMFKTMNTNTSMGFLKSYILYPADYDEYLDNVHLIRCEHFLDLIAVLVCNQNTVKKSCWRDYEKRLDYMEDMVERVA